MSTKNQLLVETVAKSRLISVLCNYFRMTTFRHCSADSPSNMSSDHLEFRAMFTPPLIRSWPFFSQSSHGGIQCIAQIPTPLRPTTHNWWGSIYPWLYLTCCIAGTDSPHRSKSESKSIIRTTPLS